MTKKTTFPSSMDTIAGYDLWAKAYDGFDNPMIAMVDWALDTEPLSASNARVLELGCGSGRNLPRVLNEGAASYVGVDGSTEMLAIARRRSGDGRASWVTSDLHKPLPLQDASFDLILITLVLEHFETLDSLCAEAHRVLKTGGRLRILEIHSDLVRNGTQAHFWHEDREIKLPSFAHDESQFRQSLSQAGFRGLALREWQVPDSVLSRMPKLQKHAGRHVLIEVEAHKDI